MAGPPNKRQKREEYKAAREVEGGAGEKELPKKKFYRQRAHANPFSDHQLVYPLEPLSMDWASCYPKFVAEGQDQSVEGQVVKAKKMAKLVDVADIGCGFGGLLVALAPKLPDSILLGMYTVS